MTFLLLTGFFLGCLHSFDVDHVVALTSLVSRRPSPRRAMLMGLSWGVGHTGAILLVGLGAVLLKIVVPEQLEQWGEPLVGVMLVLIGVVVMAESRKVDPEQLHQHRDGTVHAHTGRFHVHPESMAVGVVHGLAGTAGVMVIIPVALQSNPWEVPLFVLVFGLGTILSMGGFAYAVARLYQAVAVRVQLFRLVRVASGIASVAVGAIWIARHFA